MWRNTRRYLNAIYTYLHIVRYWAFVGQFGENLCRRVTDSSDVTPVNFRLFSPPLVIRSSKMTQPIECARWRYLRSRRNAFMVKSSRGLILTKVKRAFYRKRDARDGLRARDTRSAFFLVVTLPDFPTLATKTGRRRQGRHR